MSTVLLEVEKDREIESIVPYRSIDPDSCRASFCFYDLVLVIHYLPAVLALASTYSTYSSIKTGHADVLSS
jgi:hypothetical protein